MHLRVSYIKQCVLEELELIRVWDATLVRKAQTDETSYSMEARADLAGHQTADFMRLGVENQIKCSVPKHFPVWTQVKSG